MTETRRTERRLSKHPTLESLLTHNQNNSNVDDRDEEDRTETFQTPNARVATDTQSKQL